jgi:hypothetical protein
MAPTEQTVTSINTSEPTTIPQADPGLLAKLAAHTAFGFSRPQPAHQPEVAAPAPASTPEPVQQDEPIAAPQIEKPSESNVDEMYSVRNFSI